MSNMGIKQSAERRFQKCKITLVAKCPLKSYLKKEYKTKVKGFFLCSKWKPVLYPY
jgi:hypothetical protein